MIKRLILSWLDPIIRPLIQIAVEQILYYGLDEFFRKDRKGAETAIVSLYPPLDIQIEDFTLKSRTKYDDAVVNGMKTALETLAREKGVILPNLDQD